MFGVLVEGGVKDDFKLGTVTGKGKVSEPV